MTRKKMEGAVKKAWKELTPKERKEVINDLEQSTIVAGGVGVTIGSIALFPEMTPLFATALIFGIPTIYGIEKEKIKGATGKFARRFQKHYGKSLHHARRRLSKIF